MRTARNGAAAAFVNRVASEDRAVHDWYRFVLSFPPHLVRDYLDRFEIGPHHLVLDPFAGTGTTLVEAKKRGIASVGIEAHPMAHFAATTKTDWALEPRALVRNAEGIARAVERRLRREGLHDLAGLPLFAQPRRSRSCLRSLSPERARLLLAGSISPLPLHKTLVLLDEIDRAGGRFAGHERLALAKALVTSIGNLHFGPEVGVTPPKADSPVIAPWLAAVRAMAEDLAVVRSGRRTRATVHLADARRAAEILPPRSVDAVITSPPYPNEKDYTRTTRLESVLLGFIGSKEDLRALKEGLLRSNTRNVFKGDADDAYVRNLASVQRVAREIERRRIEMGKTSGFERQYHRVTTLYFGGMARHLAAMRRVLRSGASLAYVVGDQASFLQVMIRTGTILAEIAESLDYEVVGIDLFRERLATATREWLREEVVVLRWPGRA